MCILRFPTFLGQNSAMPQFGVKGVLRGSKTQNLSLFKPIDSKSKVVFKKSTLSSHLGGEIWDFSSFRLQKNAVSSLSPLQIGLGSLNLVCTFSRSLKCAFWVSRLFSSILTPNRLKEVVFWSGFQPDFPSHIVKENQANTVYRPTADGEGGISPKSVLGPQRTKKTIFSHVRYVFLFIFFPRTLNSFTLFGKNQNRSNSINRLSLAADQICKSGDKLGSKYRYAPIWRRGC